MTKHVQHEGHNVVSTKQYRMATCCEQNPCCCCLNAVIISIIFGFLHQQINMTVSLVNEFGYCMNHNLHYKLDMQLNALSNNNHHKDRHKDNDSKLLIVNYF